MGRRGGLDTQVGLRPAGDTNLFFGMVPLSYNENEKIVAPSYTPKKRQGLTVCGQRAKIFVS